MKHQIVGQKCCWDLDLHFNLHLVLDPRKIPQLHKFERKKLQYQSVIKQYMEDMEDTCFHLLALLSKHHCFDCNKVVEKSCNKSIIHATLIGKPASLIFKMDCLKICVETGLILHSLPGFDCSIHPTHRAASRKLPASQ